MKSDISENGKIRVYSFRGKRKIFSLRVIMLRGHIRGRALVVLTSDLHASAALNPGQLPRYPYRSLGVPQSQSKRLHEAKILLILTRVTICSGGSLICIRTVIYRVF
jgi:hypothetical protein